MEGGDGGDKLLSKCLKILILPLSTEELLKSVIAIEMEGVFICEIEIMIDLFDLYDSSDEFSIVA